MNLITDNVNPLSIILLALVIFIFIIVENKWDE
jgi:hypothetical protein